jgi:hypothetical protein
MDCATVAFKVCWLANSCSIDFEEALATFSTEESIHRITIAQTAPLNAIFTTMTKSRILQDKLTLLVDGLLWGAISEGALPFA